MPLVTTGELYQDAQRLGYGLGAYDTCGGQIDIMETIFQAAEEMKSPVIISDGYQPIDKYFGLEYFAAMARMRAERASVPVALHLDHAFKFEYVVKALRYGFTSVMFDGSRLPYAQNLEITKKVVEVAHSLGVNVEAELGSVGGLEGDTWAHTDSSLYTDPIVAGDFVRNTGIESLAPAIGNAHGFYTQKPRLDFQRLRKIREEVQIPLVLHGATGIPLADVQTAINCGIRKINLATQVVQVYVDGIRECFKEQPIDVRNLLRKAREPLRKMIKQQLEDFGSAGRG